MTICEESKRKLMKQINGSCQRFTVSKKRTATVPLTPTPTQCKNSFNIDVGLAVPVPVTRCSVLLSRLRVSLHNNVNFLFFFIIYFTTDCVADVKVECHIGLIKKT